MATRKNEIDLERALLARLFQNPNEVTEVGILITASDFFNYGKVYTALKDSIIKGKFDKVETPIELSEKFKFDLSTVLQFWETGHAKLIAEKIKRKSTIRKVVEIATKAQNSLLDTPEDVMKIIETIQTDILKVSTENYQETEDIKSIIQEYTDYQCEYTNNKLSGKKFIGIQTKLPIIDDMIDGLRPQHIWIVGGYTSTGKSTFVLNIVNNVVNQGKRVSFYSLEMSRVDILGKLLAININEYPSYIIKNADKDAVYSKQSDYFKQLKEKELLIHTKYHNIDQITMSMLKDNFEKKVDLFVVDYLQNISFEKGMSEYETMTHASREFQKIAERLGVTIILLSQVNNAHAREGNFQVMGFKGSGGIGAVADFAIELRRDKEVPADDNMNVPMTAHIMKNRHGRIGETQLTFNLKSGKIEETLFTTQPYDATKSKNRQSKTN